MNQLKQSWVADACIVGIVPGETSLIALMDTCYHKSQVGDDEDTKRTLATQQTSLCDSALVQPISVRSDSTSEVAIGRTT